MIIKKSQVLKLPNFDLISADIIIFSDTYLFSIIHKFSKILMKLKLKSWDT